jgi:pimeloyl-ACP methyl ester carboxylesterase
MKIGEFNTIVPRRPILILSCGADKGEAPLPVLLIHGFLGSREDWRPLAAALSTDRDCYAVDLPGHGRSSFVESSAAMGESQLFRINYELFYRAWHDLLNSLFIVETF